MTLSTMNEQSIKVIFIMDAGRPSYACEASLFQDEVDVVNTLFQGFIKCINNLHKGFFKWDEKSASPLLECMRGLATDVVGEECKMSLRWNNGGWIFVSLFTANADTASSLEPLSSRVTKFVQMFQLAEIEKKEDQNQDVCVLYRLIYGPKGPEMIYSVSPNMTNELQVAGYGALLVHLFPRLTPAGLKIFALLLLYAFAAVETNEFHWKKVTDMRKLIQLSTARLHIDWDAKVGNGLFQDSQDFLGRMRAALPIMSS